MKWIKKNFGKVMGDSLYRNSLYMMISTLIMSFLGFVFWMVIARNYTTSEVGLATTIISVMGLITSFSLLGLNVGLIRYLPRAKDKSRKINTCFSLVGVVAVIVTSVFLLGLSVFSPKLLFIRESLIFSFSFIFFMVVSCWASLIDSIFVAFRNAKFILVKNVTFSSLKIVFPFLFLGLGAYGIFGAWMTSLFVAVVLSMFILVKKFDYKPKLVFHDSIIKKIGKYSFGNYVAGFIGGLPLMILPLMILNSLGAETTAYYYMAMMIATLLFTIPQATSQSLFAEGSYDEKNLKVQVWKAVKIISLILIPGILITVFFGNWILLLFGKEYSSEGFRFLQILALSGIFVGGNKVFENVLRIEKRIRSILWVNIIGAVVILGGSYLLLGGGLLSIGYVWLGGQVVISLIYLGLLKR